jgi:PAS domain S-box-containing protein
MTEPSEIPPTEDETTSADKIFALVRDLRAANEQLVIRSVMEQESAESAEAGRAQLNALVEALSEGIVIADASGKLLMMNRAACAILGVAEWSLLSSAEADGLAFRNLEGAPLATDQRPLARALRGEHFVDAAISLMRTDRASRDLLTSGTSIVERGRLSLAIVVFRDVTEVRRLERLRDEYLALVSHDIRGPLSAIMLLSGALKRTAARDGLPDEVADRVSRIEKNALRISSMVTDLLETTSATGTMARRAPADLGALVASAVDLTSDGTQGRARFLDLFGGACPVLAEPGRIERAFGNLLSNALKYSRGAVEIRLEREGAFAVVSVVDHGIGIPSEDLPQVFDRYFRAESGRRMGGGFGLGLYITRLIAEAHGGRVEVESELGEGSTFRLVLPLDQP